jgi:hypothetical protein
MPVHHVSLPTGPKHYEEMKKFYGAVLAPLGYTTFKEFDGVIGLQHNYNPDFWLHCGGVDFEKATAADADNKDDDKKTLRGKTHVAFSASSQSQVRTWYENAM